MPTGGTSSIIELWRRWWRRGGRCVKSFPFQQRLHSYKVKMSARCLTWPRTCWILTGFWQNPASDLKQPPPTSTGVVAPLLQRAKTPSSPKRDQNNISLPRCRTNQEIKINSMLPRKKPTFLKSWPVGLCSRKFPSLVVIFHDLLTRSSYYESGDWSLL